MAHLLALKKRAPNSNDEGTQMVLANQTVRGSERYCQIGSTIYVTMEKICLSRKKISFVLLLFWLTGKPFPAS